MSNAVYFEGGTYKNIAAAQTTYLSNTHGIIHGVSVNTNGGTVTLYDSTTASGTPIGIIATDCPEGIYLEGLPFRNGLTVVTGSTVNVTIIYSGSVSFTAFSPSASLSLSVSASSSPSVSPSASLSASLSPSVSPSSSVSPSASVSPSRSPSVSPSISPSISRSVSPSLSTSVSLSLSPSVSPSASISASRSPSISPSASPSEGL